MKKILGILILLSSLNSHAGNKANEIMGKSFNWVTINRDVLQETIYDRLKKETPYPNEINIDNYKLDKITQEAKINISKFETEEKDLCNKKFLPKNATPPKEPILRMMESTSVITNPKSDKYYTIRNSQEYRDCYSAISNMSEYIVLKSKQSEISNLGQKRREFDESLRKDSEKILTTVINEYGLSNHIQLILDHRPSAIIYNKDLILLDVTAKIKAIIASKKNINE